MGAKASSGSSISRGRLLALTLWVFRSSSSFVCCSAVRTDFSSARSACHASCALASERFPQSGKPLRFGCIVRLSSRADLLIQLSQFGS